MILLRLISWPYLRRHLLRSALTLAGILLGVAVFVGMHTANRSVLQAFHHTIDRIAGATQLEVSSGETGFDEEVLEKVQASPLVKAAVPVIEAVVPTELPGQGSLLILGVDMTGDRSLRDYDMASSDQAMVDDPLVFLAQPDSLIVSSTFARQNHLRTGSSIPLGTMQGKERFTVRGIMNSGGLSSAFGGNLAVMDIYAAQKVFGRGRKFDRIDVIGKAGVPVSDLRRELQGRLGPGFQVEAPSARGQQFEAMSRVYSLAADITSSFALFIGVFIIYNTFSIAVAQRRSEIGILRALGATQRQIRRLFLGESLVAGLLGSVLGVGFGLLIAHAMTGYIGGLLGEIYGTPQSTAPVKVDPKIILFAVALGVLSSVIAAILPARDAAGVDPVKALQKGAYQQFSSGENRIRRIAALVLLVCCFVCMLLSANRVFLYLGDALLMLAVLLLTPTLALLTARVLRPLLRRLRPVEGTLAADSLIQAPRRTSGAVAALMLSLALVISLGGLARASYESLLSWLRIALNPDLFVTTSDTLTSRSFHFPGSMEHDLRAIDGIEEVQPVRDARIVIRGTPIMLVAVPIRQVAKRIHMKPLEGDPRTMFQLAEQGKGVLASDNFALLRGFQLGDLVEIPSPRGILKLPIVGIATDYSDQQGSILIDRHIFIKYWNDSTVDLYRVYLKPGASEADVKRRIHERFAAAQRLFVLTNRDLRRYILRLTDQWFGVTYVQIAVAVIVAILGIVNTLTVSITDRRRELGVLRAVGGLRAQIRRTVRMEALAIAAIGLILGFALGAAQLFYSLEVARRDLAGLRLDYRYPFAIAAYLVPVLLASAFVAALLPAESAVRGSLVEALEYE